MQVEEIYELKYDIDAAIDKLFFICDDAGPLDSLYLDQIGHDLMDITVRLGTYLDICKGPTTVKTESSPVSRCLNRKEPSITIDGVEYKPPYRFCDYVVSESTLYG